MRYFQRVSVGGLSLLKGMAVTFINMFRRPVTETYPHQEPELTEAFRSAITLLRFPETNTHDCIACMQCVRICPSFCITIDGTRHAGVKGKRAERFDVDYALCSLCGLCLDVCPTDTLGYSKVYDVVSYERDAFTFDLLEAFREDEARYIARVQAESAAAEAEKAARKAEAAATSPGGGTESPGASDDTSSSSDS